MAVCHVPNMCPEGNLRVCQAFNARPRGATSPQPRASERSERHPGLGWRVSDTPPEGAKAATETFKSNERDVHLRRFGVQIERTGRSFTPVWRSNRTNGAFIYAGLAFKSNERDVHLCRVGVQIERQFASVIAFAPSGGVSETHLPNPGCRSLRSLALGWGLATPSGFSLNACHTHVTPSGRTLNACHTHVIPSGRALDACHTRKFPSWRTLNACHTRKNPLGRAWDACGGTSVSYRTTVARRMRTSSKGRLFSSRPTHWMRSTTARPSVISPNTVYWPSR